MVSSIPFCYAYGIVRLTNSAALHFRNWSLTNFFKDKLFFSCYQRRVPEVRTSLLLNVGKTYGKGKEFCRVT